MIDPMLQAHSLQQFERTCLPRFGGPLISEHWNLDIFARGKRRKQMKRLKDEANFFGAIGRRVRQIEKRLASIDQCSSAGTIECTKHLQQSCLAASAWTDDYDK